VYKIKKLLGDYMKHLQFYINGAWSLPKNKHDSISVIDPSTESSVAEVYMASRADVDLAVQAASESLYSWSQTSLEDRIDMMEKFLKEYNKRYDDVAKAISTEMGAPIDMSHEIQTETVIGHTEVTIAEIKSMSMEEDNGPHAKLIREPVGVCVLITPWNWPVNQVVCKVVPALLAGCTVILKPSELTPLSAQIYAECMDLAGFPDGVFNMIHGDGPTIGPDLTSHPLVDMVSFTGSARAGIQVAKSAADTIKRVTQELGGKSANIIFADSDLQAMVEQGVEECLFNSGQSCDAPTRMLVEQSVYDDAVRYATNAVNSIQLGSAHDSGDHLGPVVSELQWQKIQKLIGVGIEEGATLTVGGLGKPSNHQKGYFVKPTLFTDVNNQMRIAQEEIFGPVLVMIPFTTESEAIDIANDSPYGLGAYVATSDMEKARRVSRLLKSGTVHINGVAQEYCTPFGGYKQSGNGREYGSYGIHEFQEIKAINGYYAD
jgi:aldehyde dehydrogenase (NAD+)